MPLVDSPVILACVVLYLAACFVVGVWAMGRTRTIADFLVAGRTLGPIVVVIAMMSSIMSGFGFVGGPGLVFDSGMSSAWMTLVAMFGAAMSWSLLGKKLRLLAEAREILTLPDAVAARYGGRAPRLMVGLAIFLGVVGYLGAQVMAVGYVLRAVLGVELVTAMAVGLGVLAFYSVAGGIIAGVYTDLFQGCIMMFAAVGVCYVALSSAGGLDEISRTLWEWDPAFIGPWGSRGATTALSWYLLFCIGAAGQPHVVTKFLMLRDVKSMRWGPALTGLSYAVTSLLWMSIGLSMRALLLQGRQSPLEQPDDAAPMFLLNHAPEWLAGVVFAGLLAAIMSTADSFLNIGAAAVVRDIPTALFGRPARRELFWTRIATAGLLVASALFALYMENLVALLGTFGWGAFAAAIVPSVCIGLNWKRATGLACTLSVATSLVLNFALELAARNGVYALPNGFAVGAFSLLAAIVVFIVVSLATPEEAIAEDVEAAMEV